MPRLTKAAVVLAAAALSMSLPTNASASTDPYWLRAQGRFAPPTAFIPSRAVTYDMALVPAAASIEVDEFAEDTSTLLGLGVKGLQPNHMYGAHVHTKPCGSSPDASGPHYQNQQDPHQPSVDSAYANSSNEAWLDFKTDRKGRAVAFSHHNWRFRPGGTGSVVIHEHGTSTEPGSAGNAGARVACFTVAFG